jgi:tartrate dehydrogenase/decarboxylase/D-malate dehydrogenase
VRPAYYYPGTRSPLARPAPGAIDFVVIRENTEGEYANIGGHVYQNMKDEVAVQTAVFTRHGTERVIRFAFELAAKRPIKKLTSVTKSNAQGYGMVFWDRVFREVAEEFPDVATESLLVDAACMDLVRRPEDFDVIVASNLFGDILTDIAAIISGSMGLAPSANLNPSREFPSMFEPVHGSAPDIAGKAVANPLAAILSAAMMLDFLGDSDGGARIQAAVRAVLAAGRTTTRDLGGNASTRQCADGVILRLAK